jgi:hypothetical protein
MESGSVRIAARSPASRSSAARRARLARGLARDLLGKALKGAGAAGRSVQSGRWGSGSARGRCPWGAALAQLLDLVDRVEPGVEAHALAGREPSRSQSASFVSGQFTG